jgi:YHS domain-containing protein
MRYTILGFLSLVLLAGCAATPGADTSSAATTPHAECLVCKANADLACVDVAVDKTTPSYSYDGKTYYFCSDECRDKFAKEPKKYATK